MKQRLALLVSTGILFGAALATGFSFGFHESIFFLILSFVLYVTYRFSCYKGALYCSLFFLALGLIVLRTTSLSEPMHALDGYAGSALQFKGIVVSDIDARDMYAYASVSITEIGGTSFLSQKNEKVLLRFFPDQKISYGDLISFRTTIEFPEPFLGEDMVRVFDYKKFLSLKNIRYVARADAVEVLDSNLGNFVLRALSSLKQKMVSISNTLLPEPHTSLLAGLLLGVKESLGTSLLSLFRSVGLAHIVVLSGYNIAIVVEYLIRFFWFLPRSIRYTCALLGIFLFIGMVGVESTVLRAGIMAVIAITGKLLHREYDALIALFLATAFMAFITPDIVLYDRSFQLSAIATFGIIIFSSHIASRLAFLPSILKEVISTTIAAQCAVAPLLLYMAGTVPLISFFANSVVLPVIPLAMFFGFFMIVLGFLFPLLASLFAFPAYVILSYILFTATLFSKIPFPQISFTLSITTLCTLYTLFFLLAWYVQVRFTKKEITYARSVL